ncbi:hypothetical protein [Kibdelosporangium phytohabitans]|uniref:SPOR domain-containing protein n=1 Tax=Kibdelosporangium phytohabitans TaxID=860235 RepID=A0A0N9HX60_9PSEU|nr:hypothetical protein [Kibdelosporangium phytohabitans]ALG06785.1 hypothetical protein AOZ06_07475 [Kibdelosporangium phytohabitans]MBE1468024.1 hypothetical protein [Kibdelosporangium phytohabitans]
MTADSNPDPGWYYCTKHNRVEHGQICRAADLLGPYPDKATAEKALQIAADRTKAADEADRRWSGEDD